MCLSEEVLFFLEMIHYRINTQLLIGLFTECNLTPFVY